MPTPWIVKHHLSSRRAKLLAIDREGNDLLKARLPSGPCHPRALLTLMEGLALWSGQPLCAAICVADDVGRSLDFDFFDGALWPPDSALVRFTITGPPQRRYRLPGMGDFRDVRQVSAPDGGAR
jgi:hypothetical protein